eukprot:TRINITY_DN1932_c0_g1_i1.p1 TRINITY_DN1932_c0_g1~~TRINITY_DN1932_c0_g1_i1.p1  ORF type:complete len:169 (+),score=23.01 TRINITY_DN1932_c0_g1_i1:30-509(+)
MRHGWAHRRFRRDTDHRRALLRNLVGSLIEHGKIRTTVEKAKDLRIVADRMVSYAKDGSSGARNKAQTMLSSFNHLTKLFTEFPQRFRNVHGGYTRYVRLGMRRGDGANMCYIGWTDVLPGRKEMDREFAARNRVASASNSTAVPSNAPRLASPSPSTE